MLKLIYYVDSLECIVFCDANDNNWVILDKPVANLFVEEGSVPWLTVIRNPNEEPIFKINGDTPKHINDSKVLVEAYTVEKLKQLKKDLNEYILSNYDLETQHTLTALYLNPITTPLEKQLILKIWDWINLVLSNYYKLKQMIKTTKDANIIRDIQLPTEEWTSKKPNITLEDILVD